MTRDDLLRRGWEFRAFGGASGFSVYIEWRGRAFCDSGERKPTLALAEKAALAAFAALTS